MNKYPAILTLTAFLFSTSSMAATNSTSAGSSGFSYAGAYGGFDLGFSSATNHFEGAGVTADQGTNGFAYGAHLGYGGLMQGPWYIGGELGIGNTTGAINYSAGSTSIKESQNYNFDADLRAGKVLEQTTLVYGKLGWAHSDFDQSVVTSSSSSSNDATFDGIRFGAGAETVLADRWTGRLEAVYTDYGSQTINSVKYAPSDVGVRFGVSYYFY